MRGSRQGFLRVSKQNPIERDPREIGAKVATCRDYAIRARARVSADSRVIGIGIGEGIESAPGHLDPYPLQVRSRTFSTLRRILNPEGGRCHPKGERQLRVELSGSGARARKSGIRR